MHSLKLPIPPLHPLLATSLSRHNAAPLVDLHALSIENPDRFIEEPYYPYESLIYRFLCTKNITFWLLNYYPDY
ncbi:hypothetical protein JOE11_000147 [Robbsia andropogonis]